MFKNFVYKIEKKENLCNGRIINFYTVFSSLNKIIISFILIMKIKLLVVTVLKIFKSHKNFITRLIKPTITIIKVNHLKIGEN
jgi:hypothetical protein